MNDENDLVVQHCGTSDLSGGSGKEKCMETNVLDEVYLPSRTSLRDQTRKPRDPRLIEDASERLIVVTVDVGVDPVTDTRKARWT